jgi:enoyl-CoA hydratase/carnithine racemase
MAARGAGAVRFASEGHLATLSFECPRRGITPDIAIAFSEVCDRCDDDSVWVVWLRGGRDFCRGIDVRSGEWPPAGSVDFVAALARVRQPVVASIRGAAEAEGVELALAADLRVVEPRTRFRMPQVERGSVPRFGGTARLTRVVGAEAALRMLLLGEAAGGRRAVEIGLAAEVAAGADRAGRRMARSLLERGPIALRFAKEAVRRARDLALDDGARFEHDLYSLLQTTRDRAEGVRAFLEKQRPRFRGE